MADTKPCKTCAEEIRAAAKVCPHCRQGQSIFYSRSPLVAAPLYGLLFIVIIGILMPDRTLMDPGEKFSDHADEIVVRDSSFEFDDCTNCKGSLQLTTVGMLDNTGEHAWKTLHFEVQYYDEAGEMIDAISSKEYSMVLPAAGETAFRVKAAAAKPRDQYASHRVIVKHAEDLNGWP